MKFTGMFMWGIEFARMLEPYNPQQKFITSGHPSLDRNRKVPKQIPTQVSFFLQAPCALLGNRSYEEFARLPVLLAKRHPKTQFVVRPHPGYPLPAKSAEAYSSLVNLSISEPSHENLSDVLSRSTLAVSVFSSVLIECLAMSVVPVICSIGGMKNYYPDIAGLGAGIDVKTIDEAQATIENILLNPESIDGILRKAHDVRSDFFADSDAAAVIQSTFI